MIRRDFIKNTSLLSLGFPALVNLSCSAVNSSLPFELSTSLKLTNFDDEQEENPTLITDNNGKTWMVSLRRAAFPSDKEQVAFYHKEGDSWKEIENISIPEGYYEAPHAACAPKGEPLISWSEKNNDDWFINVAFLGKEGLKFQDKLRLTNGRGINSKVITPDKDRAWVCWENFHNGKFSIGICKFEKGKWGQSLEINSNDKSYFEPAIAEAPNGNLFVVYTYTDGFHQNVELVEINAENTKVLSATAIAVGGGHENRVNLNNKPAIAFDKNGKAWISYENNRNTSRMEDGDNYTGDRCCAIVSVEEGVVEEPADKGKWLFEGLNDHCPTFVKDHDGNLYLFTYCGGTFDDTQWKYRVAYLNGNEGWSEPITLFNAKVKGWLVPPAVSFDENNHFWLATIYEEFTNAKEILGESDVVRARLSQLNLMQFSGADISGKGNAKLKATIVEEFMPDEASIGTFSGHPHIERRKKVVGNDEYTLIYGNLHEHSNSSNCWPAGTDGTLHDDYRFGLYSEGYDFFGMTDHAASTSEIHWRRSLKLAEFYNESDLFVAIPAIEWTLQSDPSFEGISYGAGHYNIAFESLEDAKKFIRNKHELYSPKIPETNHAPNLWKLLHEKEIKCVTIPHHSADKVHPTDWNVTDPEYVTTVEIFQCRGNNEYPGCPREKNVTRHTPTKHTKAYIDYAFKEMKYKMSFIASGDHNNMGVGVAALWVKEVTRKGIVDAMKNRRTFATTGDKMFIDLNIDGNMMGSTVSGKGALRLDIHAIGQYPLQKVEILRNSEVIHTFELENDLLEFKTQFLDNDYPSKSEVLYYYVRATQVNQAIAWSSPIWIES